MPNPVVSGAVAREVEIDVFFDQDVRSPTGRDAEGFTVRVNGVIAFADNAFFVNPTTLRLEMAGVISDRDTVGVVYDSNKGDLTDTAGDYAVLDADVLAVNESNHAALRAVVIGLSKIDPERVTIIFSNPVTAVDLAAGLSFTMGGEEVEFDSVVPSGDPRNLEVVFPNSFAYADDLLISYDASVGTWQSQGYPIVSFSELSVSNASRIGTPNSDYPLSSVVREPLEPKSGSVWAKMGIDLNFIDRLLVDRYGPVSLDTGGTFGASETLPQGVFLPQDLRRLTTGMEVAKEFRVQGRPDQAAIAAAEWLEVMTERVGIALGILRTQDRFVVLGQRTARQV